MAVPHPLIGASLSKPHTSEILKKYSIFGCTYIQQCHRFWMLARARRSGSPHNVINICLVNIVMLLVIILMKCDGTTHYDRTQKFLQQKAISPCTKDGLLTGVVVCKALEENWKTECI